MRIYKDEDMLFFNSIVASLIFYIILFVIFPYMRINITHKPALEIIEAEITDFSSILRYKNFNNDRRVISPKNTTVKAQTKEAMLQGKPEKTQQSKTVKLVSDIPKPIFKESNKTINLLDISEKIKTPEAVPENITTISKIDISSKISSQNKLSKKELTDNNQKEIKLDPMSENDFLDNSGAKKESSRINIPVPTDLNIDSKDDAFKMKNTEKGFNEKLVGNKASGDIEKLNAGIMVPAEYDINMPIPKKSESKDNKNISFGDIPVNQGNIVDKMVPPVIKKFSPEVRKDTKNNRSIIYEPHTKMPSWAEKQGIATKFRAKILITPKGEISEVRLLKKSGFAELDNLAVEHIKKILYEPDSQYTERIIEVELVTR